ncbi:E3 ubiquitin-protein ligase RNF14-like [Chelonus insularis]|uniref:E3 ubiquitin-protein ligase RNF14-like n=1 Tax=Chelonus insularis TaxID=460826 RepID=UPI00158F56B5|nr:E3 ubiquitin-protein ligase RNF14-like [Chelonus insularis]XP_034943251.1 E3 ubiquitin-protein ligase RNF14-like [Chelonus insularis]
MPNEQQKDEIIALQSIYNDEEFSFHDIDGQFHCVLKIFTSLLDDYCLIYKDRRNKEDPVEKVPIAHLPPIVLHVTLPHNYPHESPPEFTLCCPWLRLTSLSKLCRKLDRLWQNNRGQEIIFTWTAFLQNDLFDFLKIQNCLDITDAYTYYKKISECKQEPNEIKKPHTDQIDRNHKRGVKKNLLHRKQKNTKRYSRFDNRAIVSRSSNENLLQTLLDYNEKRMEIEFKKNFYTCKICFTDKSGESCTQFKPCLHIFCKDCIAGYLEVRIKDGSVMNICCPEDKCKSEALPGQIKDLVSPELFAKYDSILLTTTLDTMLDIVYCPRRHCQYPVSKEPNEKMASCPACNYVFCIYCKMVYHGIEPCKIALGDKQKLVNEYLNGSQEQKKQLENRYGQKLKFLVENILSENWLHNNSRNCPHCKAAIEKLDGCNKMTCNKCNTYFCWTCGAQLSRSMPYFHYQNPQSKCFQKLYQGVVYEEEDEDDEIVFPALEQDFDSDDSFDDGSDLEADYRF